METANNWEHKVANNGIIANFVCVKMLRLLATYHKLN